MKKISSRWERLLLVLLAGTGVARAAHTALPRPNETERARDAAIFTVYLENDTLGNTDQHYTAGTKLSWLTSDYHSWKQRPGASRLGERLPLVNAAGTQKNFGFGIGQNIYTPTRTDLAVPDPADRPYAGWSYLEFSYLSKTEARLDTLSFQVGIIGPHSYASQVQREVHRLVHEKEARGWDYQLHDEFGLNVVIERKWRMYARSVTDLLGVDFVPHVGASLGNVQTYANAGATGRVGFHLPTDFGVQLIRPGGGGSTPINDLDPRVSLLHNFSVFLFGALDGRAVGRDIFLDGNTFRSSRSVAKEAFVADISYGLGAIAGRWQLTFTQVTRTREFKQQTNRRNAFGSVTLSMAF